MRIAVVVPTRNEAARIQQVIESVRGSGDPRPARGTVRSRGVHAPDVDVIVSDGGSQDGTCEIARAAGARVVVSPTGRSTQLQTGFEAAQEADVVMFLHADTILPRGWTDALRFALADPAAVGGAFGFRFLEPGWRERWVEWGVAVRVRVLGLPYGDQAIFARRSALEAAGGIPDVPIMEDVDLVRALRRQGPLVQLPIPVRTSARRYRREGFARTVGRNFLALVARAAGIDRARIARWYRR